MKIATRRTFRRSINRAKPVAAILVALAAFALLIV